MNNPITPEQTSCRVGADDGTAIQQRRASEPGRRNELEEFLGPYAELEKERDYYKCESQT